MCKTNICMTIPFGIMYMVHSVWIQCCNRIVTWNIQGEFLYLETLKYRKRYASYKKNVRNKTFYFQGGKVSSQKLPHILGWEIILEFLMDIYIIFADLDPPLKIKKSLLFFHFFCTKHPENSFFDIQSKKKFL